MDIEFEFYLEIGTWNLEIKNMNTQFSYKQINDQGKKFLEEYLEKKISRLETLIHAEELANSRLEIRAEKFVKNEAYKIEMFLITPTKTFQAEEDDHTIMEAFDLALDKLVLQIRRDHEKNN